MECPSCGNSTTRWDTDTPPSPLSAYNRTGRQPTFPFPHGAMALPELSESVKKELRFDNAVLARPSEQKASPLTEREEASLKALRKGLSRFVKETPEQSKVNNAVLARKVGQQR